MSRSTIGVSRRHEEIRKGTKTSNSNSLVEQLDRELTCQFCLGLLDDPRMLECLHSYCKRCIEALELKNLPSSYKCPECQETFKIPDINQLPVHKIANTKKRDFLLLRRISGETMKCNLCPVPHRKHAADAIYICLDCREGQQFLCHNCSSHHYNKPELKDHHLELLNSLLQNSTSSSSASGRMTVRIRRSSVFSNICAMHGIQIRYFCDTCKASICSDCKNESHHEHAIESTTNAIEVIKEIIPTELLIVIGIRDGLQQTVGPLSTKKKAIRKQKDDLVEEIHSWVGSISDELEQQEKTLLDQLGSTIDAKLDILSIQIRDVNKMIEKADQLATMLTDVDTLSYQSDILSVTHTLLDKVDLLKKEYDAAASSMSQNSPTPLSTKILAPRNTLSLVPCEDANVGLMVNTEELKRELQDGSRIFATTACAGLCSAMGPALKHPEAFKLTYFTVRLHDKNGKPCAFQQDIQVSIARKSVKPQFNTVRPKISYHENSVCSVSFCFIEAGSYEVSVLVNDSHINQSPFKVSVVAPSPLAWNSKLFESSREVTAPIGLAQDMYGNILVTNRNPDSSIVVLNDQAEEVMRIEDEKNKLKDPCGITTDNAGNIYVTSSYYHCILKYSSSGEFIKSAGKIGRQKDQFQNPAGIFCNNNELFVCDSSNCRIAIFDTDLQFKRDFSTYVIGTHNLACPYDVAFDSNGHMFVSDTVNDCILIYKDDTFISTFRKTTDGDLQVPKGVAIDEDGHLFVCDSGQQPTYTLIIFMS